MTSRPSSIAMTIKTACNCKAWQPTPMTCCSAAWSSPRSPAMIGPPIFWWAWANWRSNKERLPTEFRAPVEILSNHISLILREQPVVNNLLERIATVPVAERLDDLTTHLNQDQQAADLIDHQYHRYLLISRPCWWWCCSTWPCACCAALPRSTGSTAPCRRRTKPWNNGWKGAPSSSRMRKPNCSTARARPVWPRSRPTSLQRRHHARTA